MAEHLVTDTSKASPAHLLGRFVPRQAWLLAEHAGSRLAVGVAQAVCSSHF
jgi:hypothetical protein